MKPSLSRPLVAALVLVSLASCRAANSAFDALDVVNLPETRAYNLEQLHMADHHHRHIAHQTGDIEYLLKRGTAGFQPGRHVYDENQVKKIDDPSIECHAELLSLCEFDDDNVITSSLQVEWCARIAVLDAWMLSRQLALRELGRAAVRLDIGVPQGVPPEEASSVDEVVAAITLLLRAYRPAVERGQDNMTPEEWAALEEAAEGIRALTLDIEAGRRSLKGIGAMLSAAKRQGRVREILDPLALDVQRGLVSQAINSGLSDPQPAVRATAIYVAVQSGGDVVLAQALTQLNAQTSEEVIDTVMRLVELYGLPKESTDLTGKIYEQARLQWLAIIVEFAANHPSGQVRVRCMRALRAVTDSGLDSLREEDWQRWWREQLEARASGVMIQP